VAYPPFCQFRVRANNKRFASYGQHRPIRHQGLEAESMTDQTNTSACATCAVRDASFCGALLNGSPPAAPASALRQVHCSGGARHDIYRANDSTGDAHIVCHGWAARFARLADGRRQILSFLIPGDLVSATAPFSASMEYSIQAITEIRYSLINRADFASALSRRPELFDRWGSLYAAQQAHATQLIVDLGRRRAGERLARLILQLMQRLNARGMVNDRSFDFPLGGQHLSDALGLAPAAVKQELDSFSKDGLIELTAGVLTVVNLSGLQRRAHMN
jgi:CRP-like cAMP-binding protein